MTIRAGSVYLVGAGPGDPGLMTVRGLELLRRCDVVVHDRLVAPSLLDECRAGAEVIDAGKAPGAHRLSQEQINALLVERARSGRMVVRLKGGDPFVFGRGGEEAEACAAAGVACEVVPGVSSAIAGPALAGIPLTSRGVARHFAVVTAQQGDGAPLSPAEWAALAGVDTLVVMMGVAALAEVARALMAAGRPASTPVAIVERAAMPGQRRVDSTLDTIERAAAEAGVQNPAVIVVGACAAAGRSSDGPLTGRRVMVTRPRSAGPELASRLMRMGAEVIDCPLIDVRLCPPPHGWDGALAGWDVVAFTSRHGVRGFMRALSMASRDLRSLGGALLAAVGPTTAAELVAYGAVPDIVPAEHRAGVLADAIAEHGGGRRQRVLFACGTLAREELPGTLRAGGHEVEELVVYETRLCAPDERARREVERGIDAVLLASPSGAEALARSGLGLGRALVGCIGPSTAAAAERHGLRVAFIADDHSDRGLVEGLARAVGEELQA